MSDAKSRKKGVKTYETRRSYAGPFVAVIYFVSGVLELLLLVRFALKVIGTYSGMQPVKLIYSWSEPFVAPFRRLSAASLTLAGREIEWITLVAVVVFALAAWILAQVFKLVLGRGTKSSQQTVEIRVAPASGAPAGQENGEVPGLRDGSEVPPPPEPMIPAVQADRTNVPIQGARPPAPGPPLVAPPLAAPPVAATPTPGAPAPEPHAAPSPQPEAPAVWMQGAPPRVPPGASAEQPAAGMAPPSAGGQPAAPAPQPDAPAPQPVAPVVPNQGAPPPVPARLPDEVPAPPEPPTPPEPGP